MGVGLLYANTGHRQHKIIFYTQIFPICLDLIYFFSFSDLNCFYHSVIQIDQSLAELGVRLHKMLVKVIQYVHFTGIYIFFF